jgi:secondary thiamine-phosphate synthase enzyme
MDLISTLELLAPLDANYQHMEGNSDAHIKTLLTGASVTIPIVEGSLALGTWQAVFFTEYDGPRTRKLQIMTIGTNDKTSNS